MVCHSKYFGDLLFVLLLGLSSFSLKSDSKTGIDHYSGEILIDGLHDKVTIYRDQRGMPHIYASNEHDLYFAVGFVSARERLWQMDLVRRSGSGRLSEIFGRKLVQADRFFRCLGLAEKTKQDLKNADPEIIRSLQDYTEGVNYYILNTKGKLPPEFGILSYKPELWTIEDIGNLIGMVGWSLTSHNLDIELFCGKVLAHLGNDVASALVPDINTRENVVYPEFNLSKTILDATYEFAIKGTKGFNFGLTGFSASNNWAVSGKKSLNGKPLFSNDMHLPISSPGIWFQMHQVIPGKLNVTGVLFAGAPFIIAGHNSKIAWGMTNMFVDVIDLFSEKINPDDSSQYYLNGKWVDMSVRKEIIKIKGSPPDTFTVRSTHRGPIISGLKKTGLEAISMKWSGLDPGNEIGAIFKLNRAEGWKDFRSALSNFKIINQNFIYADTNGNIGLVSGGGIPVRKYNSVFIRNGVTDEYDWKGYVPSDELPFSYNPEAGYVSSANNKTVSDDYPYYISTIYATPYRINRIRQLLDQKEVFSMDDFKAIINDQHSDCALHLVPFILKLQNKRSELSERENEILTYFINWDHEMNKELICPSIFEYFRLNLLKNILKDNLGELFDEIPPHIADNYLFYIANKGNDIFIDNVNTGHKESMDDIVHLSFTSCIKEMENIYGNDINKWKWGNIHTLRVLHPLGSSMLINFLFRLNSGKYPVGGSDHTINMFRSLHEGFNVEAGPSVKNIFNTSNWDESFTILPTGESGVPKSEFYLSQTKTFLEGGFYNDVFSDNAVRGSAKYTLVLKALK